MKQWPSYGFWATWKPMTRSLKFPHMCWKGSRYRGCLVLRRDQAGVLWVGMVGLLHHTCLHCLIGGMAGSLCGWVVISHLWSCSGPPMFHLPSYAVLAAWWRWAVWGLHHVILWTSRAAYLCKRNLFSITEVQLAKIYCCFNFRECLWSVWHYFMFCI